MAINDGGSAFPQIEHGEIVQDGCYVQKWWPEGGMSLRDWFAGQALASFAGDSRGVIVAVGNNRTMGHHTDMAEREARNCAEAAYAIADAMLAARLVIKEP
jgi:hypothetical protein